MRTSTLLLTLTLVAFILLTFPEESHEVIFVLTQGRIKDVGKEMDRKRTDRKRRRNKARRNKNRKKKKLAERKKLKELKRWLARFSKKNKNSDNGDGGVKKKPIWSSKQRPIH